MNKSLFSSKTNEWATPQAFFDRLDQEFHFTLDPCATPENAKVSRFYTIEDDGLSKSWAGERVFMNPPYGNEIGAWVRKAYQESRNANTTVVCLIPARTDTRYWHEYVMKAYQIRFVKGRIAFGNGTMPAPFPSAVVIFNGKCYPMEATAMDAK